MSDFITEQHAAHLVRHGIALDMGGATIELLTGAHKDDDTPAVMRGSIPSGGSVPLHSHPEPETFILLSGELDGLVQTAAGSTWSRIGRGEVFHVPSGARHAFRNQQQEPAISIVVSTGRMARFFCEIGTPIASAAPPPDPPSEVTIRHFLEVAARYGHWNATPEENAEVGLSSPAR